MVMLERWRQAGEWDKQVELTKLLHDVDFTWRREFFSDEYRDIHNALAPGPTRTRLLDSLMLGPIEIGSALRWNDDKDVRRAKVRETWERGDDGDRLFALGIMAGNEDLALIDLLLEGIRASRSAFEQYCAVRAAYNAITPQGAALASWMPLSNEEKAAIMQAINEEVAGLRRVDGSPARLATNEASLTLARRIHAQLVDGVVEHRPPMGHDSRR